MQLFGLIWQVPICLCLQGALLTSACEPYVRTSTSPTPNASATVTTASHSAPATASAAGTSVHSVGTDNTTMTAVDSSDSTQSSADGAVSAKRRLVEKILKSTGRLTESESEKLQLEIIS